MSFGCVQCSSIKVMGLHRSLGEKKGMMSHEEVSAVSASALGKQLRLFYFMKNSSCREIGKLV